MDQHPVPQNISSYEFRLVGDMTLKQFFQLAGGGVVALVFYRSPFPGLIKWPLAFLSVLGGILLAFVPLQGRPFSQWILAFFKAVYSPTEFYWHPAPVGESPNQPISNVQSEQTSSPLDKLESQLVTKVSDLFNSVVHHTALAGKTPEPSTQNLAPSPISPLTVDHLREIAAGTMPPPRSPPLTPIISHAPKPAVAPAMAAAAATMFAPIRPNILAGVVSQGGEIPIEGAILEIAEKATGLPVRALKTNKLGQFQIATPLANGEYVITTEKEGFVIDPVTIVTSGQVISPIDIRGQGII